MIVKVETEVSYSVDRVVVDDILIRPSLTGLSISARHRWIDDEGRVIRRGSTTISSAELAVLANANELDGDGVVQSLTALVPRQRGGSLGIAWRSGDMRITQTGYGEIEEGEFVGEGLDRPRPVRKLLDDNDLGNAGLSKQLITGLVEYLAYQLTQ